MRSWLILLVLLWMASCQPVFAQSTAKVVATCGSASYTAGSTNYVTVDITGATCGAGGAGGGATSVTAASGAYVDCAIVTLGCEGDNAWVSGNGTGIALLKAIDRDVQSTGSVQGVSASGTTASENPLLDGCTGATAMPAGVSNAQKVAAQCTPDGRIVVKPYSVPGGDLTGSASATGTGATTIIAAQGAGIKIKVTDVECFRTDAGATMIYATLNDASSTPVPIPPVGANNWSPKIPLTVAANTALTFTASTGVSTLFCSAQGYASQ